MININGKKNQKKSEKNYLSTRFYLFSQPIINKLIVYRKNIVNV